LNSTIFIQIASYRDPELIPTLLDLISKSSFPENLRFGIARQYSDEDRFDNLDSFREDPRFKIINIPYRESRGACWARNLIQQLYNGEDYTLQIDSHMRFEEGWDVICIEMINQLIKDGHSKPILTSYVSSYDPKNDPGGRAKSPWRMVFDRFIPEGAVFFLPESIPSWESLDRPVPARFYSAHFCFTLGIFSKEVKHDPDYYFHGEEISISVRAYTHGYDLFHPHRIIAYHEYTRKGRVKQWDDDKNWGEKNRKSHEKNRILLGMEQSESIDFREYGLGKIRTLRDYEKYAGILFSQRSVQNYTLDKNYPPNPYDYESEQDWIKSFVNRFKYCINLNRSQVQEPDYDFWVVAFHSESGETIFRKDCNPDEIKNLLSDSDQFCKIWRTFLTNKLPSYWVVWPHSVSKGWCKKIEGKI
jgi:glycosyltransferase involved in cell wall biosynthesis